MNFKIYVPKKKPLRVNVPDIIHAVLSRFMKVALREARHNVSGGGRAKDRLNVRSGALRRSITETVERDGMTTRGVLGTNIIYGRIHEMGGTIRPVSKQYLTIPMKHLTASGRAKSYSASTNAGVNRMTAGGMGAANTFVKKAKSGKLFIFAKLGKDKIVPIFMLVKQVVIPARPYLTPEIEKIAPTVMDEIGTRIVREAVN